MFPPLSPCGRAYRFRVNPCTTLDSHLFCMSQNVLFKQTSSQKRNCEVKIMMDIVAALVRGCSLCGLMDVVVLMWVSVMGDLYTTSISGLSGISENREWVGLCPCSVVVDPFPASFLKQDC